MGLLRTLFLHVLGKKNPSQLIWMWNLGSETTWQGLCELKSIFTPSDNERDGGIFTNIWLFPVPPSCTHKSLSADMPRVYVQRKFQPSQLPKHLFPSWNPFWFLLHSNDFTFFFFFLQETECLWQRRKIWKCESSTSLCAAFLLGWPLTISQFLLFFVLSPEWIEGPAIPTAEIQWILWSLIN